MILITGGAGFIGSTLVDFYSNKSQIVVVDDLSMGKRDNITSNKNVTFIKRDISNPLFLEKIMKKYQFTYIFHLAAVASVADSIERPVETHKINFDSALSIIELSRRYQKELKKIVFASSAAVYGDNPVLPKKEDSLIKPLSPYAVDKFAAERYILNAHLLYDLPTVAVRFFNVFGPRQNPESLYSGVISIIINKYKQIFKGMNSKFTIFGDGTQSRDFIFIEDVIQALDLVAKSEASLGQVYNVGTGKQTSLNELIEYTNKITDKELSLEYTDFRVGDIQDSYADISKLSALGFVPRYSVEKGLEKYFDYELVKE